MVDLEYKDLGLFTMFLPVGEDGVKLYNNELNQITDGTGKVFTIQLEGVLYALKRAGYRVKKLDEVKIDIDELYDALL